MVAFQTPEGEWIPNATYPERPEMLASGLTSFIDGIIAAGATGQVNGPHGIGKTSTVQDHVETNYPDIEVVRLNLANLSMEDLLITSPQRHGAGDDAVYALTELLSEKLTEGSRRYKVLHVDDGLQAYGGLQDQLFQTAADLTLGSFNLRDCGFIAMLMTDNDKLSETANTRTEIPLLDRIYTRRITAADVPWKQALAAQFSSHDLTGVFRAWAALPTAFRENIVSPRCLEHIIDNLLEGNPGIWGLPLLNGVRTRLITNDEGQTIDSTMEFLDSVAGCLGVSNPTSVPNPVDRLVEQARRKGRNVLIQGPPGCGKTQAVKAKVSELVTHDPLQYYWSMSTMDPDMLTIPVPMEGKLRQLLRADFYAEGEKMMIFDERNRPKDPFTGAKMMELLQERTIAGMPIPGLRGIIAMQNPPVVMGHKTQVTKENIAQMDRFYASIEVNADDIDTRGWLLTEFPKRWAAQVDRTWGLRRENAGADEATRTSVTDQAKEKAALAIESVLEWWDNDLDQAGRDYITARGQERLATWHLLDLPLDEALLHLPREGAVPVPLAPLRRRLASTEVTGLREIVADVDTWCERLWDERTGDHAMGNQASHQVLAVLQSASMTALEDNEDAVTQLISCLANSLKAKLIGAKGDYQRFFYKAIRESKSLTEARAGFAAA